MTPTSRELLHGKDARRPELPLVERVFFSVLTARYPRFSHTTGSVATGKKVSIGPRLQVEYVLLNDPYRLSVYALDDEGGNSQKAALRMLTNSEVQDPERLAVIFTEALDEALEKLRTWTEAEAARLARFAHICAQARAQRTS